MLLLGSFRFKSDFFSHSKTSTANMPPKNRGKKADGPLDEFVKGRDQTSGAEEIRPNQETSDSSDITNKELKDLLSTLITKVEDNLGGRLTSLEAMFNEKMIEVETRVGELDDRVSEIEKDTEKIAHLESKITELKDYIMNQEARSRKYNLLVYGIPKQEKENPLEVLNQFLQNDLQMEKAVVDSLIIQNAHRIPRNPDNRYKETAPEAIIVKFACLKDRNIILARVHEVKLPKGKSVRTDLPGPLKKMRAQLAQKAYQLRKEGLKTRIIEKPTSVELQVRRATDNRWSRYDM